MHHAVLERWSQRSSPVHRRDPRAKIFPLLIFLLVLATAHQHLFPLSAGLFVLLSGGLIWARLPLGPALARAAVVLPFTLVFALISWLAGEPGRALSLLAKTYLSALAVVFVVGTTPFPALLRGLEMPGVPRFLLLVTQFLYRYLFVIAEEAQHMARAALSRGASARQWFAGGERYRAAAGALAVLFSRSYARAEQIHQAMRARGFQGHFQLFEPPQFRTADAIFAIVASLGPPALRVFIERAGL